MAKRQSVFIINHKRPLKENSMKDFPLPVVQFGSTRPKLDLLTHECSTYLKRKIHQLLLKG